MSHFEWENIDINAGNTVTGVISNIDYENLIADVEGVGTEIPIHYHCEEDAINDTGKSYDIDYPDKQDEEGATAFSENDVVLVMYRRVNNEDPVIIGFPDEALSCLGEYVLIRLYGNEVIDRCIVWSIRQNRLATDVPLNHLEEDPEIFAIFPCNPDDISDWLDKHVSIGEDLYSGLNTQVGESGAEECTCTPPLVCGGGWWSSGSCHDENSVLSDCPGANGEPLYSSCEYYVDRTCYNCPNPLWYQADGIDESYYTIPALKKIIQTLPSPYWNQGLMGSYKLSANNMTEETLTCLRNERKLESTFTYACSEVDSSGCTFSQGDETVGVITDELIAPFASMGIIERNGRSICDPYADPEVGTETGELVYAPGTPPVPEQSIIKQALFSDRSMVQLFFYEQLLVNRTRPCAVSFCLGVWIGGSPEYGCEWTVNSKTRHTLIVAHASDLLSQGGTEDVDPREMERQTDLEDTVVDLVRDFYTFNGAADDEIWDFGTEVSIRDKDETIP